MANPEKEIFPTGEEPPTRRYQFRGDDPPELDEEDEAILDEIWKKRAFDMLARCKIRV